MNRPRGRAHKITRKQVKSYGYTRPNPGVTTLAAINGRGAYSARSSMRGRSSRSRRARASAQLTAAQKRAFARKVKTVRQRAARPAVPSKRYRAWTRTSKATRARRSSELVRRRAATTRARTAYLKRHPESHRASSAATKRKPMKIRRRRKSAKRAAAPRRRRKAAHRKGAVVRKRRSTRRRRMRKNAFFGHSAAHRRAAQARWGKHRSKRRSVRRRTGAHRRHSRMSAAERLHAKRSRAARKAARTRRARRVASHYQETARMGQYKLNRRRRHRRNAMVENRRRRRHRRAAAPTRRRRRRSTRRYAANRRRHATNRRRHARNRRSYAANRRLHRNRRHYRRNARRRSYRRNPTGVIVEMLKTGLFVGAGFFAEKLLSGIVRDQLLARVTGSPATATPPAASGLDALQPYNGLIASAATSALLALVANKVLKNPADRNLVIAGVGAGLMHTVAVFVLNKIGQPAIASALSGEATATRLAAMYGYGAVSLQPNYAPIGEYFSNTAGMGEYFSSGVSGMGAYESNPDIYQAAAGIGADDNAYGHSNHVMPGSNLDRELSIAEAAAGIGALQPYEASAGMGEYFSSGVSGLGAVSTVPSRSTWIPGTSDPQLWAGVRAVNKPQSASEMQPAGLLETAGGQGIFG